MLIWSEQFSTGSPMIDGQHRQLFSHLNELEALLVQTSPDGDGLATITGFIDFLQHSVDAHIAFEEECMDSYHCPAGQNSRDAHEHFREMLRRLKALAQKKDFRRLMLAELTQHINTWLEDHILHVDIEMKPCFSPQTPDRRDAGLMRPGC